MPPPLPDRYELEVRLGRDGDIEQWLGSDVALDRPVLIQILGPDTTKERRHSYLAAVGSASGLSHVHLAQTFEADLVSDGAYSVTEWLGGITLADRLAAGETLPVEDFLANGAGLADALATLHDEGILHGSIDPSAILYSYAHPAKLSSFGRSHDSGSAASDVRDLATTLEVALSGSPVTTVPPSQIVDGISRDVDVALKDAKEGRVDAAGLARALGSVPEIASPTPRRAWSWSWTIPAGLLLVLAAALILLGASLEAGPLSPVLFPARPATTPVTTATTPTTVVLAPEEEPEIGIEPVAVTKVAPYDPFGDDVEQPSRDRGPDNLVDTDASTEWRTERYLDPLSLQKPGVGVTFAVAGSPSSFEAVGVSPGAQYALYWASAVPEQFEEWGRIAAGTSDGGTLSIQLPNRSNGVWLFWFTELPEQPDGYYAGVAEVRFRP